MTENFILADEALIRKEFSAEQFEYKGDGTHGKGEIRGLYEQIGINYKETYHGVKLLKKTHLSRAAERSPCIGRFFAKFHAECWWNR